MGKTGEKKKKEKKKTSSAQVLDNESVKKVKKDKKTKDNRETKEVIEPSRKSSRLSVADQTSGIAKKGGNIKSVAVSQLGTSNTAAAKRKVSKRPADVDDDDSTPPASPKATTSSKKTARHIESEDESDVDKGIDEEEKDEDEDPMETHLAGLSAEKAKAALKGEQASWPKSKVAQPAAEAKPRVSTKISTAATSSKRARSEISDVDAGTETSTSGSDSESSSDSDSESSLTDSDSSSKSIVAQPLKGSKRANARREEAPRWKASGSDKSRKSGKRRKAGDINEGWSSQAHYVPPSGKTVSLTSQPTPLKTVLKEVIELAEGNMIFDTFYPIVADQDDYFKKLMMKSAKAHKFKRLAERISQDSDFRLTFAPLISNRTSRLRGNVKKGLLSSIQASYALPMKKDSCQQRVADVLDDMVYIYPISSNGDVLTNKPYQHPLIITSLRTYFFEGRASIARRYAERFTSSIKTDEECDKLEIPIPMLAMVATAIRACLDDWKDGYYRKSEWNAEAYASVYLAHVEFLEESIRDVDLNKYHRLMSNLYLLASNTTVEASSSVQVQKAKTRLNMADMEM